MMWRNPAAWLGLLTLLIPIAIHLLVRQQAESRPFPSLRFIQPSRLASVRRRFISDWPLLLVRLAMIAAAVAALADPLWRSASRRAAWNARQAVAIVADTSTSAAAAAAPEARQRLIEQTASGAFRSATFDGANLVEAIARAADWLQTTPPARREIVVLSDFQIGALDAKMLASVPASIGVRFVRLGGTPVTRTADGRPRTHRGATAGTFDGRTFEERTPRVILSPHDAAVTWQPASTSAAASISITDGASEITLAPFNLRVRTNETDRPIVLAAAQAVLAQGVAVDARPAAPPRGETTIAITTSAASRGDEAALPRDAVRLAAPWMSDVLQRIATDRHLSRAVDTSSVSDTFDTNVPAPWLVLMRDAGGRPAILAAARANAGLLLVSRVAASDEATPLLMRATLDALDQLAGRDPLLEAEVLTVPDATLAQWQRSPGTPPASEWQQVESTDRRYLWAAALLLLALEQFLRRRPRRVHEDSTHSYEHAA